MPNEDLTVRLKADDQLSGPVKDAAAALDALEGKSVDVKVGADTTAAETGLDAVSTETETLDGTTAEVDVGADTGDAEAGLGAVSDETAELDGTTAEVEVGADTSDAEAGLEAVAGEVETLDGTTAEVAVTADTGGAQSAIGSLKTALSDVFTGGGIQGAAAGLFSSITGSAVGMATAAGAAVAGFAVKAVADFNDVAMTAGEMRDTLGLSAEDASRWVEVAGDIGVSSQTIESTIGKMNKTLGATPALFKDIVVESGGITDVNATFLAVIDHLNGIKDPADRAREATKMLGKGWAEVAELINLGAADVKAQLESVSDAKVVGDDQIADAREFRDALDDLKGNAEDLSIAVGQGLVPVLSDAAAMVSGLVGPLQDLKGAFDDITNTPGVKQIYENFAPWKQIPTRIGQVQSAWDKLFGGEDKSKIVEDTFGGGDFASAAERMKAAIEGLAAVGLTAKLEDDLEVMRQWAEEALRAEEGTRAFADTVGTIDFGMADIAGGLSAMGLFNDMLFAQDNQVIKNEESFKALSESVKENGANFDVNTEKGRANQSALEGVARALEDELAAAYADANGDQEVFEQTAGRLAHDTLARLQEQLGLSAEETFALGAELGLLPEDLETRYELSGAEEAKLKLGLLQTSIDLLPKDVQATVTQQIIAGDYVGALATVENYYATNPATMTVNAETQAAIDAASAAQLYADSLVGTETVDGQWEMAQAAADAAKAYADGLVATEKIDAENEGAISTANSTKDYIDMLDGIMGIGGNNQPAKASADDAVNYADRQSGDITIRANLTKGSGWDVLTNPFNIHGKAHVSGSSATPTTTTSTGLAATTTTAMVTAAPIGRVPINIHLAAPPAPAAPAVPPIVINLDGRPVAALIRSTTAPAVRAAAMAIRAGRA